MTDHEGGAPYYARGRWSYPAVVAETIRSELGLDGRGRLLDIGCGPGSLTLLLAPLFATAVGIDANAGMVEEAERAAESASIGNARFRTMRGEDLPGDLGSFRLVTFAQSFHWMDEGVAIAVRRMPETGGACIIVRATTHKGVDSDRPVPFPRPPHEEIEKLIARYLTPTRRSDRAVRSEEALRRREAETMRRAGFDDFHRIEVGDDDVLERSEDQVVASVFSLSSSAPGLFGQRLGAFETELRSLLRRASPTGRFSEVTREIALDIWR